MGLEEGSVYSFFSMCSEENIEKIKNENYQISSARIVTANIDEWIGKMKRGSYLRIEKTEDKSKGYILP